MAHPVHHPDIEQAGLISEDDQSRKRREEFDDEAAEVQVVRWENFRMPIPVDHATFMRKVFFTLTLQLLFTAGIEYLYIYYQYIHHK